MKFLISIFAIYIMALSMVPCSDKEDIDHDRTIEASANWDDDHSAEHTEHCTPFCICSCCSSSVMLEYIVYSINTPLVYSSIRQIIYNSSEIISFNSAIWQPPKI